ncbi:hypothetical protein MKEN_00882200 [Mycena kentingensis (nom. inval.)]|nr:hypothetical protein MKEN_00882200 [Mycena kentingensis (nom. inval.)]
MESESEGELPGPPQSGLNRVTGKNADALFAEGESRRTVSWIWTMTGGEEVEGELIEALRIEWSKSWARTRRWREEKMILEEEWRRLGVSLAYEEARWKDRAAAVPVGTIPAADAEGMIAYAVKHADMYRNLALRAEATRTAPALRKGAKRGRTAVFCTTEDDLELEDVAADGWIEVDEEDDFGYASGDSEPED